MKKQEITLRRLVSILLLLAMAFGTGCSVRAVSETAYAAREMCLISEYSEETGTARVSDETDMSTDTKEPTETEESSQAVAYDPQPTTTEEIQAWIDAANTAYQDALVSDGFLAAITAMKGAKPHWQYAVEANLMPEGYHCAFVTDDGDFGADYYTFFVGAASAAFTGSGGSGTQEDPYQISNPDDLVQLRTAVNLGDNFANAYFVLTKDIELSGTWTPIGTALMLIEPYVYSGNPFSGTLSGYYNGVYYSITDLTTTSGNFQGLFGFTENATIENLSITTDANGINGTNHIGGLIGYARNTTIKNCSVAGLVEGAPHTCGTGGLVGAAEASVITGCEATNITVKGNYNTGGLLGIALTDVTVKDCSATGTVTATGERAGGLIGHVYIHNSAGSVAITNSEADVDVTSSSHSVGGLIGRIYMSGTLSNNYKITVENCRALGRVTGTSSASYYFGGLIGTTYHALASGSEIIIKDCYAEGEVDAGSHSVGGLIAYIQDDHASGITTIQNCHASGDVSGGGHTVGGLIGYAPTDVTVKDCSASGDVTGRGDNVGGLIGHVLATGAGRITTIQNCHASGDVTGGGHTVGGLIGYAYGNISINGCSASGDVTGGHENIGGLIGLSDGLLATQQGVVIKNSWATGDVTGNGTYAYQVGGFIGDCYQHTDMTNCYAAGNIDTTYTYTLTGLDYAGVGGFIGLISFGGTAFTNCYALGRVSGRGRDLNAGSFLGRIYLTTHGLEFINCYATGTVTASGLGSNSGGFVGGIHGSNRATLTNCFFDTTMTGTSVGVGFGTTATGSLTGIDTKTMIDMDTFSAWGVKDNFEGKSAGTGTDESPWYIDDDVTYPYLYYQYDGHTKEETNYNIIVATWNNTAAIYDRTDFNAGVIPGFTGSGQFTVENIGADRMYFPYATGKNKFGSAGATITIPSAPFSSTAYGKYSLGSASATDIVAFINRPGAVKASDRKDDEDASGHVYGTGDTPDGVTDTYVGDTVTYDITITHYMAVAEDTAYKYLHTWRDVVVSDPLADHVSFVEGSVTIRYNGEPAITAEEGTEQNQYSYDEGERTLNVFLEDMEPEDQVVVTFQLFVEKEAVGKSIRNAGAVKGTFKSDTADETKEHAYENEFDDKNDDPVKDAYKVTYDGNGGAKTDGSTKKSYYYHVSTTTPPTYTVLDNRHEDLGFVWSGHAFTGWNTAADGSGTPYTGDGSEVLTLTDDMTLYAQWEEKTIDFRFLKVDAKTYDETEGLPGAKFKLYICADDATGGTHTHDNTYGGPTDCWQQVGDEETSADGTGGMTKGLVTFTDLASGTYLLVETAVPGGYELPQGQWILAMDATATTGGVTFVKILNSHNIPAIVTASEAEIDLLVGNIEQYTLPGAGFGGYTWFTAAGALLLVGGGVWLLWFRHRKRTTNLCKGR